jgi:adenine-specific DNA-methyltransferase
MIESEFLRLKAEGKITWGKDGTAQPSVIRFLNEVDGLVPWTWWTHEEVGHTDEARKEIQDIFATQTAFDTPKPLRLMERVLQICAPEKDALVLDFFAGSGTTAHAVLKMNSEDGGHRRWVMVSSREATPETPDKNLARDVCRRRLQAAILGYRSARFDNDVPGRGGSFAYVSATPVPMHRLEEQLSDDMVWLFALLSCDHPVAPRTGALSVSVKDAHLVAYCCNTKLSTVKALKKRLAEHHGNAVVFSWAPQALEDVVAGREAPISIVAVPGDLRRAFKQGNSAERDDDIGLAGTEAAVDEVES